jgi:hypothetical protein
VPCAQHRDRCLHVRTLPRTPSTIHMPKSGLDRYTQTRIHPKPLRTRPAPPAPL